MSKPDRLKTADLYEITPQNSQGQQPRYMMKATHNVNWKARLTLDLPTILSLVAINTQLIRDYTMPAPKNNGSDRPRTGRNQSKRKSHARSANNAQNASDEGIKTQRTKGKARDKTKNKNSGHQKQRPARTGGTRQGRNEAEGSFYIYGIHAVEAALNNPARPLHSLKLTPNAQQRLAVTLRARAAEFEQVTPKDLDHLLGKDCVHQGAALQTDLLPEPTLAELADLAANGRPLILLDQVTDPHNLGAIVRSCAVFGAAGIITTRRSCPPLTGTVAKTASGGLEHVPLALVPNLARAMGQLKDLGFGIIGLDGDSDALLQDANFSTPFAMVLGAEGAGLRRLTRDNCDVICRIAAPGPVQSLNVSNAAAVCLHLAAMQRTSAR